MGFRFSKSFKLGATRLNLSKRGVGMSVGGKGFRVGTGPRGAYTSVGIPGTGISQRSSFGGRRKGQGDPVSEVQAAKTLFGCMGIAFLTITELILVVAVPPVGIPVAAATVGLFAWSRWKKPNNPQWQFQNKGQEAVKHVSAGNWEEALRTLEECERIMPDNPATLGLKGQVLFQLRRCEEAIPLLQANTTNEAETLMLAEALRHVGRYRESIEVLKTPPVDEALMVQALIVRAANHVELGEPETAIEILKTAPLKKRNLDDKLKQVHYILAKAYEAAGKKADALKHLRRVYAADAGFMDVESELRRLEAI